MLNKQIIENGIRNIKANLGSLIDIDDVPYIISTWQRNFKNWEEHEFKKVIEYFIDNADNNTRFPRPYDLKSIYYELIEKKKIQQEYWDEMEEFMPMPEETKKRLKELMSKISKPKEDGKI